MKLLNSVVLHVSVFVVAAAIATSVHAYQGMPLPKLHVAGRFLQDPSEKSVLLHGYMQPAGSWFNGEGHNFNNPTDFTNPANVSPALNFYKDVATIMTTTSAQYGQNHGWSASFVRFIGDHTNVQNFAPGWDVNGNLASPAQFNGWINNVLVPYVNHCASVGLYVVICGNPSVAYPGGDATKNMTQQYRNNLTTFWQSVANTPGIKSASNVMFEICNEPIAIETNFGANNWGSGSAIYWSALKNFMQPIVDAIRNTGADNIVMIPSLGWQGECHGFASYPINGANIAYAGHVYPAYGNVFNNATAVQNLWSSNYKPAADIAPLFVTEMFWSPNDGVGYKNLFNGTTAGFGNAVKNAMDNQGNVSFLVGMTGDLIADINSGLAATVLPSTDGTLASFAWWNTYAWAAPSNPGSVPVFTYHPASTTISPGDSVIFSAAASGTPAPTFQWQKDGVNISGATSNTYSIFSVTIGDAGNYNAVATNSAGFTSSNTAVLTVNVAPAIITQPLGQITTTGNPVTFTVAASGSPAPTYQWKKEGVNISGATGNSYTLASTILADVGSYTVVVTNVTGFATSNAAVLALGTPPGGFDVAGYLTRNPVMAALYESNAYGAWRYYHDHGIYQGEVFDELFRVDEYLALYPDLHSVFGGDLGAALDHWLSTGRIEGKLGRIPVEFNATGYFTRNPDVAAAVNNDALLAWGHYWLYGIYEGRAYDEELRVFEYLAINADLTAAFVDDWRQAALHWMRYGRTEGRLGRLPLTFNVTEYLVRSPDVATVWGTNPTTVFLHYWAYGIDEGRTYDDIFRPDEYLALNPDLGAALGTDRRRAFKHWVRYGMAEGRPGKNP